MFPFPTWPPNFSEAVGTELMQNLHNSVQFGWKQPNISRVTCKKKSIPTLWIHKLIFFKKSGPKKKDFGILIQPPGTNQSNKGTIEKWPQEKCKWLIKYLKLDSSSVWKGELMNTSVKPLKSWNPSIYSYCNCMAEK